MTNRSDNAHGSPQRRDIDRRTWAEYDRIGFDQTVRGTGEHLTPEPIYFGRAYSSPPTFTYSMSSTQADLPVVPMVYIPSRGFEKYKLADGRPNCSLEGFYSYDPGFEMAGMFADMGVTGASTIPDVACNREGQTVNLWNQIIHDNWTPDTTNPGKYRQPWYANAWVQGLDRNERWSIVTDRYHDLGKGYRGTHSAKWTWATPGSSNWLLPTNLYKGGYEGNWDPYYWPELDVPMHEDIWGWTFSRSWPTRHNSTYWDTYIYREPPPMFTGWRGFAYVYSDGPCEFEAILSAVNYYGVGEPATEKLGVDGVAVSETATSKTSIGAGQWQRVDFFFPYVDGANAWPNTDPESSAPFGYWWWNYKMRLNGGIASQNAWIDNFYIWPESQNYLSPLMTIGVAEWITDDQGGYIGAKLFYKAGF